MDAKHFVKVFKKKGEDKYFVFVRANGYFIFAGPVTGEEMPNLEAHIDFAHAFPEFAMIEEQKRSKSSFEEILKKRNSLFYDVNYSNMFFLKREYEYY